jgi:hypothetical protein
MPGLSVEVPGETGFFFLSDTSLISDKAFFDGSSRYNRPPESLPFEGGYEPKRFITRV